MLRRNIGCDTFTVHHKMSSGKRWLATSLFFIALGASAQETPSEKPEIVDGARLKPGTLLAVQPMATAPRIEAPAAEEPEASLGWQPFELGLAALGVMGFVALRLRH